MQPSGPTPYQPVSAARHLPEKGQEASTKSTLDSKIARSVKKSESDNNHVKGLVKKFEKLAKDNAKDKQAAHIGKKTLVKPTASKKFTFEEKVILSDPHTLGELYALLDEVQRTNFESFVVKGKIEDRLLAKKLNVSLTTSVNIKMLNTFLDIGEKLSGMTEDDTLPLTFHANRYPFKVEKEFIISIKSADEKPLSDKAIKKKLEEEVFGKDFFARRKDIKLDSHILPIRKYVSYAGIEKFIDRVKLAPDLFLFGDDFFTMAQLDYKLLSCNPESAENIIHPYVGVELSDEQRILLEKMIDIQENKDEAVIGLNILRHITSVNSSNDSFKTPLEELKIDVMLDKIHHINPVTVTDLKLYLGEYAPLLSLVQSHTQTSDQTLAEHLNLGVNLNVTLLKTLFHASRKIKKGKNLNLTYISPKVRGKFGRFGYHLTKKNQLIFLVGYLNQGSFKKVDSAKDLSRQNPLVRSKIDSHKVASKHKLDKLTIYNDAIKELSLLYAINKLSDTTHLMPNVQHIDKLGSSLFFFGEKFDGDAEKLKSAPLKQKAAIFLATLKGVKALHEAGYVHYDLKPANILFQDKGNDPHHAVVSDFGFVVKESTPGKRGAKGYSPPEHYTNRRVLSADKKADTWSEGATLWDIMDGSNNFLDAVTEYLEGIRVKRPETENYSRLMDRLDVSIANKIIADRPNKTSYVKLGSLIKALMTYKPEDRLSDAEAVAAMQEIYDELWS